MKTEYQSALGMILLYLIEEVLKKIGRVGGGGARANLVQGPPSTPPTHIHVASIIMSEEVDH